LSLGASLNINDTWDGRPLRYEVAKQIDPVEITIQLTNSAQHSTHNKYRIYFEAPHSIMEKIQRKIPPSGHPTETTHLNLYGNDDQARALRQIQTIEKAMEEVWEDLVRENEKKGNSLWGLVSPITEKTKTTMIAEGLQFLKNKMLPTHDL
jgi:hypothetical protein